MPMHRFVVSNCLFNIDDRYQVEKFLGKGSYGVVWYVVYFSSSLLLLLILILMYSYIHISIIHICICTFISSSLLNSAVKDRQNHDKLVAIKKISHFSQKTSSAKHTLRELRLLRYLGHHPNIMCLENAMIMPEEDEVYLVMSIMDTDLHHVIQSQESFSDQHLRVFYINS